MLERGSLGREIASVLVFLWPLGLLAGVFAGLTLNEWLAGMVITTLGGALIGWAGYAGKKRRR
jgi:hypothetical protein